jgi:cytokinin dehydrogenase
VTGRGLTIEVGPGDGAAAYEFTLGGIGRAGIIVAAEISLRTSLPNVRTFYLMYEDLGAMLADQRTIVESRQVDHLEGFCVARMNGLRKGKAGRRVPFARWYYGLCVSVEHEAGFGPGSAEVLRDLHEHELVHTEDDDTLAFASRYDVRFEGMRATGAWEQKHPWFECILPVDRAEELVPRMLERLPLFLGDGHRISWIANTRRPRALAFPLRGPWVTFAVLPAGVPSALGAPALAALEDVDRMATQAGGKRYPSGWLFGRGEEGWRTHFGDDYDAWKQAKAELDPGGTFESSLFGSDGGGESVGDRGSLG